MVEPKVTLDMLNAGMAALRRYDPDTEEEYALVWAIISAAEEVRLAANSGWRSAKITVNEHEPRDTQTLPPCKKEEGKWNRK